MSNASSFGVKWMAHLFAGDLGSPVVAYNTTLGKAVVYVGNERGDIFAVDAQTGQELWSTNLGVGDAERDTPAVAPDGTVWVGTNFDATLYKLNGANGQILCSLKSPNAHPIMGSPMIVTPPGANETVFWDAVDSGTNGPFVSTNEATCAQNFNETVLAGSWTTPTFAIDGAGEPLALIGTADPGCNEVAYDAITGNAVWSRFLAANKPCVADVGDAASVSPPGVNGFADGVDYVADDGGYEYALDLNTGATLWEHTTVSPVSGQPCGYPNTGCGRQIATIALDGSQLVYGYYNGVTSLNATNGNSIWNWSAPAGIDSSPAIVGPKGSEIVAFADLTGMFHMLSLSSGSPLYSYQTGGYIAASAAEYNGTVYITSADGFLYAFAAGGGNGSKSSETIAYPGNGASLPNPGGSLAITGTASDAKSVAAVEVAVQSGGKSGPWWNAATNTWNPAPVRNEATLASPGAAKTNWSFSLPIAPSGNNFTVFASSVNSSNLVDSGSQNSFTISPSSNEPTIHTSVYDAPPGSTFTATGNAFRPGETATFTLFGQAVATATVGTTGNVPQTAISVPTAAAFGPTSITVTGNTSQKSASAQIYISNAWTQQGYSALRTYMEPDDHVINHTIFVGASVLNEDWMYPSGAAINTTPAIEDGVAYFGNDAGTLSAVTVSTGAAAWTYTIASAQPIRSSPAIDDKGRIVFGANDGRLYVVSSTGLPVTSVALGGDLGAPAYANGNIVIGSSTGMLYSLADSTMTTRWTVNVGAPITQPPAYDAAKGLVIVGASSTVIAYSSSTGVKKWTATTGGPVSGVTIAGTQVLVGSADGYVYAFNERTGAQNWKITGGDNSAVTTIDANGGGPAWGTQKGGMYEASSSGNVYYKKFYTTGQMVGIAGAGTDEFGSNAIGDIGMLRAADGAWFFRSGAKYSVGPVLLNGMIFQGAQNGSFVAFIPEGYSVPPQSSVRVGNIVVTVDGSGCTP